jgi:hypothetical protein
MLRLVLRFGALHHRRDGDEGRGEARLDARPRRRVAGFRGARAPARQRRDAELREAPHRAAQPPTEPVPATRLDSCAAAAEPDDVELPAAVAGQPEVLRGGAAWGRDAHARLLPHSCCALFCLLAARVSLLPLLSLSASLCSVCFGTTTLLRPRARAPVGLSCVCI